MRNRAAAIRTQLDETRAAFHTLLDEIPADAWERPSRNPAWNIREMAYHITIAVNLLPQDIKMIRRGGLLARLTKIPPVLFNWLNERLTRRAARRQTKEAIAQRYDAAHESVLQLLATIGEDEWEKTAVYPNLNEYMPGGEHTLAMMFDYLTLHFQEHARDIRANLPQKEAT
jgi:hypothetical protein